MTFKFATCTHHLELSHVGVHEGHPGVALGPGAELGLVLGPVNVLVEDAGLVEHPVPELLTHEPEVVPPQQLEDDPVGGVVRHPGGLVLLDLPEYSPRRQAASRQPGTELKRGGEIIK